ncbi:putative F-box protein At3g25750 [Silene latifolia]|uniref:putative F-box protein At3g25750 n=1 Tax=Silene latifolia TaxID=37657 RepID=UPI003D784897
MTTIDRGWSMLPRELVEEIILKIDWPEDVLRFSRVCRAWFDAFMRIRPKWTPANPWILLSENTHDNPECLRKAYNPGNNKFYQFKLPETFGRNCWGSDLGWIITLGLDLEMSLFNPLTKLRLYLPCTNTLMRTTFTNAEPEVVLLDYGVCKEDCEHYPYWMREVYILRACILKTGKQLKLYNDVNEDLDDDDDNDGLFVAVIHVRERVDYFDHNLIKSTYLSVARPGDIRWTLIETPSDLCIRDVIFWRDLLWFTDNEGSLWYVDLNKGGGPSFKSMECLVNPQEPEDVKNPMHYLVQSSNQELLLVKRFSKATIHYTMSDYFETNYTNNGLEFDYDDNYCAHHDLNSIYRKSMSSFTQRFRIYKLDLSSNMWKPVVDTSDFGGITMFLGKNTSQIATASRSGTCKANCIYFTGEHIIKCGHDIGIYNLDSDKIEAFYNGHDTDSDYCIPFWFTPLLY